MYILYSSIFKGDEKYIINSEIKEIFKFLLNKKG